MELLSSLLSSKTRAKIFELIFADGEKDYYLRELERKTGLSTSSLRFEMKNLIAMDLISPRRDGNRLYYAANTEHSLFSVIQDLVNKSSGPHLKLTKALQDISGIELAFIFGSYVTDGLKAHSDIDLFVVGKIRNIDLSEITFEIQKDIGREINYHKFTRGDVAKKLKSKNHFLSSLKKEDKLFVKGFIDEFREIFKR
ncbi:MAG: toxin-antitoxin system toxin subunit [Bdellovibrionales bacterium]|jgi:predicted nucleotidyltransferase|nr:toxin-antitoxin system toxin subunit [Bdellovibrionales bacterium]